MSEESISDKLKELFDLHKSGALSKDEFEILKKQILSEEKVEGNVTTKSKELETVKTSDKPVRVKKRSIIWILAILSIVFLVTAFFVFKTNLFPSRFEATEQKAQTVKDIDDNEYLTITIGTQVWMVENLKTTKFNDGSTIALVTDSTEWAALTTPAFCWYNNNDTQNKNTFGALYNWYAAGTNKLCPLGWHVPSNEEWTALTDYLTKNGYGYEGSGNDIGKSIAAKSGWIADGTAGNVGNAQESNNKSGFTALQGGYRFNSGSFLCIGSNGKWWSSSESSTTSAYIRFLSSNNSEVTSYANRKRNGFSIRCLRDLIESKNSISDNNNSIKYNTITEWDSASAIKIIIDELTNFPDWSKIDSSIHYQHKINSIDKINLNNKVLHVAIVISSSNDAQRYWSIFEFENREGWKLGKKAIAFTSDNGYKEGLYNIAPDNYCVLLSVEDNAMGGWFGVEQSLFAFLGDELKLVFSIENSWQGDGYSSNDLKLSFIHKNNGFYDIENHERIPSGNDEILGKVFYKFNGEKYIKDTETTVEEYVSKADNIPVAEVSFEAFLDDNVPIDSVTVLRKQFIDGNNQHQYSTYSNHTYTLKFNAPYLDEERGYEPDNIRNGIQRGYFINSENVCIQRQLRNGQVIEEIYFHPNGKIYTVINIVNDRKNGDVKYVDLDNYVFLQGRLVNGSLAGYWDTPTMGSFNMQSRNLAEQYPGVVNSAITFINFYKMDRDTRQFNMN